ncbi:MAG TPA: ELWxxDGT repeat protein, partial [Cytophagales bacterium]
MSNLYACFRLRPLLLTWCVAWLLGAGPAAGQPQLVKDILGSTAGCCYNAYNAAPTDLTVLNGVLYYAGSNGESGRELWRSDGTAAGTRLVKDLWPGANSSNPAGLVRLGATLYFTAESAATGTELWRSSGTNASTFLVQDLVPGPGSSSPANLTAVNGTLFFTTYDLKAWALWRSNGTAEGTELLQRGKVENLTNVNGTLYFTRTSSNGWQLWKSDGTADGTLLVHEVNYSSEYQDLHEAPANLTVVNGILYFSAVDEAGRELWKSDGTGAGTVRVKDIYPGLSMERYNGSRPRHLEYLWFDAASGGSVLHIGSRFTTPALAATTHYYVAAQVSGCANSARTPVTVTVAGALSGTFRVNAGGNAFATLDARRFLADAYVTGGVVSAATSAAIAGTADDYLYQTGRHGASFSYNFPTGNGAYDVVLHFAETYFGAAAPGGVGSRRFHVNLEGVRKLTDYDVFAKAGGALRATQETFRVSVADGTLNVAFLKGAADNPAVKAIEVLPAGSGLAINAGGSAYTTGTGKQFSADVYYADGAASSISSGEIANTADDALYRNARVGVFSYGLPSGNGTFDVTLHFAETYFGSRVAGGVGSRKFNVYLEGVKRLSDYDVFAKAGGAMRAAKETIQVTVSDGVLNLYFAKGLADNPLVSAIEVTPATVAAREGVLEAGAEDWPLTLFPNPVRDRLTVTLPFPAGKVEATAITDAAGGAMKAVQKTLQVTVSDGVLNLYFAKGTADNPLVSAIEVTPATTT